MKVLHLPVPNHTGGTKPQKELRMPHLFATSRHSWGILLGWLLLVGLVATSGALTSPGEWYNALDKPRLNPPSWVFPVVWTALYLVMAIAAWQATLRASSESRFPGPWPFVAPLAAYGHGTFLFFGLDW